MSLAGRAAQHVGGVGLRRARRLRARARPGLQVRRLLALARLVRLERRLRRVGQLRHRAEDREGGQADRVLEPEPVRVRERVGNLHRVRAAARGDPDVLAVGVAGAALRGDPLEPVGRLLEHPPDRLGRVLVGRVDRLHGVLRPRDHDLVEAAREGARLVEERDAAIGELGEPRDRRAQVGGQPAQLALRDQQPHLLDERSRGGQGRRGRAHAGERLARERAHRREGRVQVRERGLGRAQDVGKQLNRAPERLVLGRERAGEDAEVGDQVLQRLLVAAEPADDPIEPADHPGEVAGLAPEHRLVDLGRVLERRRRGPVELAEPIRSVVLGERVAELVQEHL